MGHPGTALPLAWSDNEIKMAKDMQETFRASLRPAGGTFYEPDQAATQRGNPTESPRWKDHSRSLGTARMGKSQDLGAEQNCQAHDVKNLFVTDAASFVTA